jgi:hypothetical protein
MALTLSQQKAVAIAPKFTAGLSAICSLVTCVLILRSKNGGGAAPPRTTKISGTYHRLVLGMSLCNLSSSVAWFFTTWPIPRGTTGVYGAIGTQGTCTAQAFFAQFSLSSVMYNASLSVYFVLVIVKGWSDDRISRVEPYIHLHAVAWGLGTACASVGLGLFNQVGWDCWISAYPTGCDESWNNDSITTCERGDNGSLYQWAFYYAPLWAVIITVTTLMYTVYHTVRVQERKMERLGSILNDDRDRLKKSRKIAVQAAYYVGAFYVTWFFPTIFQLVLVTNGDAHFALLFLTAFFVPTEGLLNLIVFVRPKYGRYKRNNPDQFPLLAWFRVIQIELGCGIRSSEAGSHTRNNSWLPSLPRRFSMKNDQQAAAAATTAAAAFETEQGQDVDF